MSVAIAAVASSAVCSPRKMGAWPSVRIWEISAAFDQNGEWLAAGGYLHERLVVVLVRAVGHELVEARLAGRGRHDRPDLLADGSGDELDVLPRDVGVRGVLKVRSRSISTLLVLPPGPTGGPAVKYSKSVMSLTKFAMYQPPSMYIRPVPSWNWAIGPRSAVYCKGFGATPWTLVRSAAHCRPDAASGCIDQHGNEVVVEDLAAVVEGPVLGVPVS